MSTGRIRRAPAHRNNIGDVWVVAKVLGDAAGGKPASTLRARAHLLVTVPLYMRFDPTVGTMTSIALREFHPFEAAGRRFLYLVPSAAVFALDDCSSAVLDSLANGPRPVDDLTRELASRFDAGGSRRHDRRVGAGPRARRILGASRCRCRRSFR